MIFFVPLLNPLIEQMILAVNELFSNAASLIAIGLTLMLSLWRLWRFSIHPYFRPDDPKELPYWIPGTYSRFYRQPS